MRIWKSSCSVLVWLAWLPMALGGPTPTGQALEAAGRMVVAQCRRATIGSDTYWTSQPGAIRSFDRRQGDLLAIYKLYSSPEPVVDAVASLTADRPTDWAAEPDRWVDLNQPAVVDGALVYPIADPRADAEGFGSVAAVGSNPLPMPVAWLYLTRDGTVGPLDAGRRFVPMGNPRTGRPTAATVDNPLIARVGWWADDATCKININTASEGVFWDTPRCDTDEERAYGRSQPARGEWQRDMGHPAAVCLSSVLFPGQRLHLPGTTSALAPLPLEAARMLWRAAPGIPDAGSMGGTVSVDPGPSGVVEETITSLHGDPGSLATSPDLPEAAKSRLARGGFFLSAHSRAPDFTRDGRPRLSLWPLNSPEWELAVSGGRTPSESTFTEFDGLMIAATALHHGGQRHPMAVVRSNPRFQHSDLRDLEAGRNLNRADQLMNALLGPRIGSHSFERKYGSGLYSDLNALVAAGFDYIRGTNVSDPGMNTTGRFVPDDFPQAGAGQVTPMSFLTTDAGWFLGTRPLPRGLGRFPTVSEVALVVGLRNKSLVGQTPAGFYAENQDQATALGSGMNHYELEVGLLIEGFVPAHGAMGFSPRLAFTLAGYAGEYVWSQSLGPDLMVGSMYLNGKPLVFPKNDAKRSAATTPQPGEGLPSQGSGGGGLGVRWMRDVIAFKPILFSQVPGESVPRLNFSGTPRGGFDNHLRLLMSYVDVPRPADAPTASGLVQSIPLAFPEIRSGLPLPFDDPEPVAFRGGGTNRMERARASGELLGNDGLIHSHDIVLSLVPNHGDFRLLAAKRHVLQGFAHDGWNNNARTWPTFVAHPDYGRKLQAHALTEPDPAATEAIRSVSNYAGVLGPGEQDAGFFNAAELPWPGVSSVLTAPGLGFRPDFSIKPWTVGQVSLVGNLATLDLGRGALSGGTSQLLPAREAFAITRYDLTGSNAADGPFRRGDARPDWTGDFDNGVGQAVDGPYVNAPDPGDARAWAGGGTPYFDALEAPWVNNPGTFSPYRHVPSAMGLGSLPSGVQANVPWQTLLFRPDPHRGTPQAHFGSTGLPDHVFADFFRMPVVKPSTAVDWRDPEAAWKPSDAFSTEGRINMNCEVIPFAHLRRTTALHALLKAQKLLAIPDEAGTIYKAGAGPQRWRHHIDPVETLRQWEAKFSAGDVFRTSSEIAELWLVPEGATLEQMPVFWARHRLTGDNTKERPYANIFPHLTTRSLTYDLHVVTEGIVKSPATPPDVFVPGVDAVTARTQQMLKITGRIDPHDPGLPNYAGTMNTGEDDTQLLLDGFIEWSAPDLPPPASVEPVWRMTSGESPRILEWTAAPGQVCVLETSTDLEAWTVRGRFATGEWRNLLSGYSGANADSTHAAVYLEDVSPLFARLRWIPGT